MRVSQTGSGRRRTGLGETRLALTLATLIIAGCTGVPRGVTPVQDFEVDRYLGTWFEIARLDHSFERGLTDVTAVYTVREHGGLEVVNRGYEPAAGQWREVHGKAFLQEDETVGRLAVSFFGPFYGGYNVIALDTDGYGWSMVAGPNRSFLWILARTPWLEDAILDALIEEARVLGFPVGELIEVSHTSRDEPSS
jgi:apolipoprotein D and lipocalin family protein